MGLLPPHQSVEFSVEFSPREVGWKTLEKNAYINLTDAENVRSVFVTILLINGQLDCSVYVFGQLVRSVAWLLKFGFDPRPDLCSRS